MPRVETYTPESLDEVAALLLAADGPDRPVVAGPALLAQTHGQAGPMRIVVDLGRVPELNRVEYEERTGLLIGAAVSIGEPLRFPPVQQAYAILADGVGFAISDEPAGRTTFGECLGNPASGADLSLPLICLGASVAVYGPHGWSEISVEALYAREPETRLQRGEFVVDVRLPPPPARSGSAYVRSAGRGAGGAALGVGALLVMHDDLETCCGARLAARAGATQPFRALDAERFLQGRRLTASPTGAVGSPPTEGAWLADLSLSAPAWPSGIRDVAYQAIGRALNRARPHSDPSARARRP